MGMGGDPPNTCCLSVIWQQFAFSRRVSNIYGYVLLNVPSSGVGRTWFSLASYSSETQIISALRPLRTPLPNHRLDLPFTPRI